MSENPDPRGMLTALAEPFPPNAIQRKQNRYSYVEHQTVTRRLNSVAEEWSFVIRETWFRDDLQIKSKDGIPVITMVVLGELTIPGLGTRSGYGVANIQIGGGEDQYKGAESDALKKAASRFGVALDLYGPDYEDVSVPGPAAAPTPMNRGASKGAGEVREMAKSDCWAAAQTRNMTPDDFGVMLQHAHRKPFDQVNAAEFAKSASWLKDAPQEEITSVMHEAWADARRAG